MHSKYFDTLEHQLSGEPGRVKLNASISVRQGLAKLISLYRQGIWIERINSLDIQKIGSWEARCENLLRFLFDDPKIASDFKKDFGLFSGGRLGYLQTLLDTLSLLYPEEFRYANSTFLSKIRDVLVSLWGLHIQFKPDPKQVASSHQQIADSPDQKAMQSQLYSNLVRLFSTDEIKTICFELGIDYELIEGESKSGKVRELILYCMRRDLIGQLWRTCKRLRPTAIW